jgi:hypothetical protein
MLAGAGDWKEWVTSRSWSGRLAGKGSWVGAVMTPWPLRLRRLCRLRRVIAAQASTEDCKRSRLCGSLGVAPLSLAPLSLAPLSLAPLSLAPLRLAPLRLAPLSLAPLRLAPLSLAPLRLAPLRLAPLSLAPLCLVPQSL